MPVKVSMKRRGLWATIALVVLGLVIAGAFKWAISGIPPHDSMVYVGKIMRKVQVEMRRDEAVSKLGGIEPATRFLSRYVSLPEIPHTERVQAACILASHCGDQGKELLRSKLDSPDASIRLLAATALGNSNCRDAKVMLVVWSTLPEELPPPPPWRDTIECLTVLFNSGARGPDVVSTFLLALGDPDAKIRAQTANLLGCLEPVTDSVVKGLVIALDDASADVRHESAEALFCIGPEANEAEPALKQALADQDPQVRCTAAAAFLRVTRNTEDAIPVFLSCLADGNPDTRQWAISYLGSLVDASPLAKSTVPALMKALGDESVSIRVGAADALGSIGTTSEEAVSALERALRDDVPRVRTRAADALGRIGPIAAKAVPSLRKILADGNADVRLEAAGSLIVLGTDAKGVVPVLTQLLREDNPGIRWQAASLLGEIGPSASKAVSALTRLLRDENQLARAHAVEALKKIRGEKQGE